MLVVQNAIYYFNILLNYKLVWKIKYWKNLINYLTVNPILDCIYLDPQIVKKISGSTKLASIGNAFAYCTNNLTVLKVCVCVRVHTCIGIKIHFMLLLQSKRIKFK